jgi:hypothetical protein
MANVWTAATGRTTVLATALFLAQALADSPAAGQGHGWRKLEPGVTRPGAPVAGGPAELELQAAADVIDRIEAGRESQQDGRLRTEPVTDVLVRIRPAVRRFRGAGQQPGGEAADSYVEAQLRLVSGGRMSLPVTAQCDRLEGDLLVCTIDCEGGTFGLRRGRSPGEHFLVLGSVGASGGDGLAEPRAWADRPGFRLAGCSGAGAGLAPVVVPRAGRLATEVRLLETGAGH